VFYTEPKNLSEANEADSKEVIQNAVRGSGAQYLLIGSAPAGVKPEVYYQQFVNYETETAKLKRYQYKKQDLIKVFEDGSELIYVR
jgi:hypothetical protein